MRFVLLIPNRTLKLSDGILLLGSVLLVRSTPTILKTFQSKDSVLLAKRNALQQ